MFRRRVLVLSVMIALLFYALIGRLAYLQIIASDHYAEKGEKRRVRLKVIPPARGRILDCRGRVLAADVSSFDLWLIPARNVRKNRRMQTESLLGDLSAVRLMQIAESTGPQLELEKKLALRYLSTSFDLVTDLSVLLGKSKEEVAETILDAALKYLPGEAESVFNKRLCFENVPFSAYLRILKERESPLDSGRFDAIEPRLGSRRIYPGGIATGHLTGVDGHLNPEEYKTLRGFWKDGNPQPGTGEVIKNGRVFFGIDPGSDEEQMVRLRESDKAGRHIRYAGYLVNDMIGFSGVEEYYNQELRGRHLWRLQQLALSGPDLTRQFVDVGQSEPAQNGKTITLTIDLDLQQQLYDLMARELEALRIERRGVGGRPFVGCAVIMDVNTGEIRAMVSVPGFDPNTYRQEYKKLLDDPRKPLINRVISGRYPPGSTIKPIYALGLLNDGQTTPAKTEFCDGVLHLGGHDFVCHNRHRHGDIDIATAIMKSCNIYFYHAGEHAGGKRLYQYAWDLGLGRSTGIDLAAEANGQLPANARTGKGWSTGATYNMAIGQGAMTVTPLQIAVAYSAIANGGKIVRPHVRYDPNDAALNEPAGRMRVSEQALETVREGMWRVVNEPGGTGYNAVRIPRFESAGKTGSAQHSRGKTHAWYACYAPFQNPEIALVVLVPEGNLGGSASGPIAKKILKLYFHLDDKGVPLSDTEGENLG